jgi:arsenic resistance protein ArsH
VFDAIVRHGTVHHSFCKMAISSGTSPVASRAMSSLAITAQTDDAAIRAKYRPFLHDNDDVTQSDWISKLVLNTVESMVAADLEATQGNRLKVLVLYGSLRSR